MARAADTTDHCRLIGQAPEENAIFPSMRILLSVIPLVSLCLLTACQGSFGPGALKRTHPAYNRVIVDSVNEQMLQNLVRIRYRDVPFFLEIGSVTASLSLEANAGVNAGINLGGNDTFSPGAGLTYSDNPTISFTPLQGENLLKSILSPLQLESLLVLTQSGWSISRVFGLCLEHINNIYNAPTASGPTPDHEPDYRDFNRLLFLLRNLQRNRLIEIGTSSSNDSSRIVIKFLRPKGELKNDMAAVYELLGLDTHTHEFTLSTDFLSLENTRLTVRPRSISSLLYYLSQNIDIPKSHQAAGLITVTSGGDGGVFDWNVTPAGQLLQVRSSIDRPEQAAVATWYRGHWFYIDDHDLRSKSTFILLRQLFDLQAGQTKYEGPTLTLPVGGR